MKLSNITEDFINQMLSEAEGGEIELKRNALADKFSCVPSQINYVISTRFSPERGYIVESRRGGGGYIKIIRVTPSADNGLLDDIRSIGDSITFSATSAMIKKLYEYDVVTKREATIIINALSEKSLAVKQPEQDRLRAKIHKNVLISIAGS